MSNFIVKTFYRSKAVKAIITYPDKRVKTFWVVPKGHTITIGNNTFNINKEDFYLHKGIPTYFYNTNNTEPVNVITEAQSKITPDDYNVAISSAVARDFRNVRRQQKSRPYQFDLFDSRNGLIGRCSLSSSRTHKKVDQITEWLKVILGV